MKGATTATLEYEVGANVYDPGASQDLATLKVRCNGVDLAVPSKVVSKENNEANLPFKLVIENVAVSDKLHWNSIVHQLIILVVYVYLVLNYLQEKVEALLNRSRNRNQRRVIIF